MSYAPVNEQGFVDVEALAELLRPDTILVSVMAVNNEIGSIQPIQAISDLLANELPYLSMWMLSRLLERFQYRPI